MPDEPAVVMRQIAFKEVVSGVNPVDATWIGVSDPEQAKIFELERCGELFVGTESGASLHVDAAPERILAPFRTLRAFGPSHIEITPKGPTCVVYIRNNGCERTQALPIEEGGEEKVSWANGAMSATFSHSGASNLYFGILEGTAAVGEHMHEGAWEILFPHEAAGDVTVSGEARRVVPHEIIAIPPNAKHAWRPDPGTKLRAFQVYTPSGPEMRFRNFAARDAVPAKPSAQTLRLDKPR